MTYKHCTKIPIKKTLQENLVDSSQPKRVNYAIVCPICEQLIESKDLDYSDNFLKNHIKLFHDYDKFYLEMVYRLFHDNCLKLYTEISCGDIKSRS